MKKLLFILPLSFLVGCYQVDCKKETEFYKPVNVHFQITKKYNYNHSSWLEGRGSDGSIQKFQYYSFFWIDKYAKIGDYFSKDSNELKFVFTGDSIRYTYFWKCGFGSSLLVDTLKK